MISALTRRSVSTAAKIPGLRWSNVRWSSGRMALKVWVACRAPAAIPRSAASKSASECPRLTETPRRAPEPLESRERRSQQVFRWVYPATHMADEWTLKMDPERAGAIRVIRVPVFSFVIALAFFDRTHQPFERAQNRIHWGGDGSGKITRDPVPCQQLFDGRQRLRVFVHDIEPRATVNVKINVARRHHAIAEVGRGNSGGKLAAAAGRNFEDASFVDEHERTLDGAGRSQ